MTAPIYDRLCKERGFDPIRQRNARIASKRIVDGVTGFFRDLFGWSAPAKRSDVALAR
ncbi:hypothetical protein [Curtobacterium sp. VKM Ac-1376]|uniref:hypothetical protein n=1 Tax=Curtobacterium sp. VKM Ac-1376 TaxID=123312 RepID=UPI00188B9EB3|nr:hypothetical protein [Curtobacterium sp. VKM Ac-1376]MBF4613760.1 hypothetical protein [Curtobacterium sp. VKM Ac-1376]